MNAKEFMERVGISVNTVTKYKDAGVIKPVKQGRGFEYSEEDVKRAVVFKDGKSVQESVTDDRPPESLKHSFNLNCYGEQVEPGTGTYNRTSFFNPYVRMGCKLDFEKIDPAKFFDDGLREYLDNDIENLKRCFEIIKAAPDKPHFDKYFRITSSGKLWSVYSMDQVWEMVNEARPKLNYLDFETLYVAAMREFHAILMFVGHKTIENYLAWDKESDNIFDVVPYYVDTVARTYEPVWYKKGTTPKHGDKTIRRAMDSNNKPLYSDEEEEIRFSRNVPIFPDDLELPDGWRNKYMSHDGQLLKLSKEDEAEYERLNIKEIKHIRRREHFYTYYKIEPPKKFRLI